MKMEEFKVGDIVLYTKYNKKCLFKISKIDGSKVYITLLHDYLEYKVGYETYDFKACIENPQVYTRLEYSKSPTLEELNLYLATLDI